ncbi:MAG TPA: flagellar biosynthesis protein FlhF, partial [Epsilonproteobacteria bacterium]|nr:flagellar biosynthesis protein FlhF [Campylobacterota bacterium]
MINETFVASSPKEAFAQAVEKYGTDDLEIVSAKQLRYDDGQIRAEVVIAVDKALFREKSFGIENFRPKKSTEEAQMLDEIGALKTEIDRMKENLTEDLIKEESVAQ